MNTYLLQTALLSHFYASILLVPLHQHFPNASTLQLHSHSETFVFLIQMHTTLLAVKRTYTVPSLSPFKKTNPLS